jgi:hypothetical protein
MGRKKRKFNKTEESIFTLSSLCVLSQQTYESLVGSEHDAHLNSKSSDSFKAICTDTIYEALVYQILLKACAYLDEWNKTFGIRTEEKDKEKIIAVKQLAKPAFKCLSVWKHLREFRNEAIAHNHRTKNGENIYLIKKPHDSPQTTAEIYLVVFCLNRMTRCIDYFFEEELNNVIRNLRKKRRWKDFKRMSKKEIKNRMKHIDNEISDTIMRSHILNSIASPFTNPTITHLKVKSPV